MEKEFKDTMNKVWEAVKKVSLDAYEKGREYTQIAELKIKINSYNKEKNNLYAEIGQIVHEAVSSGEKDLCGKGDVSAKCKKIDKIIERVNALEFEIKCIKEEHGIKEEELNEVAKKATAEQQSKEDAEKRSEKKKTETVKKKEQKK